MNNRFIIHTDNFSLVKYCLKMLIIYYFMPAVSAYTGVYFAAIFLLPLITIVLINRNYFIENNSIIIGMFVVAFFFYANRFQYDSLLTVVFNLLSLVMVVISILYLVERNASYIEELFLFLLKILILTELSSVFFLSIYPDAARYMAWGGSSYTEEYLKYCKLNIAGLSIAYVLPGVFFSAFSMFKRKRLNGGFIFLLGILSLLFLIRVKLMIPLLLFVVVVCCVILSYYKPNSVIRRTMMIIIVALLLSPLIGQLMLYLSTTVNSYDLAIRFKDLGTVLTGGSLQSTEDLMLRIDRYVDSIRTFAKFPITGGYLFGHNTGGHSDILDFAARWGMLGLFFLLFVVKGISRKISYQVLDKNPKEPVAMFAMACFMMSLFLHVIMSPGFMICMLLSYSNLAVNKSNLNS